MITRKEFNSKVFGIGDPKAIAWVENAFGKDDAELSVLRGEVPNPNEYMYDEFTASGLKLEDWFLKTFGMAMISD